MLWALLGLLAVDAVGLLLVVFGLPGLWIMVLALIGYGALTEFQTVGPWTMILALALAGAGEAAEAWLGFRFARRYGGSSRAAWGALLGGIAGAIVGVPVPIVGSIVGAFVGSFVGAAVLEFTRARRMDGAALAGWGAVLGRAAGAAVKVALGVVIAVLGIVAVLRA